jgi:hypothetical protein
MLGNYTKVESLFFFSMLKHCLDIQKSAVKRRVVVFGGVLSLLSGCATTPSSPPVSATTVPAATPAVPRLPRWVAVLRAASRTSA